MLSFSMDKLSVPVKDQTLYLILDPSFSCKYHLSFLDRQSTPFYWIIPITTLISPAFKRDRVTETETDRDTRETF